MAAVRIDKVRTPRCNGHYSVTLYIFIAPFAWMFFYDMMPSWEYFPEECGDGVWRVPPRLPRYISNSEGICIMNFTYHNKLLIGYSVLPHRGSLRDLRNPGSSRICWVV